MSQLLFNLAAFSRRSWRDRRGNVAMLTALVGFSVIGISGLSMDMMRATSTESALQNAADAAALVAERMSDKPLEERQAAAAEFFRTNIANLPHSAEAVITIEAMADGGHRARASIPVDTTIAKLIFGRNWQVDVSSDADEEGSDLEVAMILDTSGSMAGQRITDLRAAAVDLTNIIVRDEQTPYYSKVALVPYSVAVNVGGYANAVRGTPTGPTAITDAGWKDGTAKAITSVSGANPAVVTAAGHGFHDGDTVYLTGIANASRIINKYFQISNVTANTFALVGVNGANINSARSEGGGGAAGGAAQKCFTSTCEVRVTAVNHGLANDDYAFITGVNGMTQINNGANGAWKVKLAASDTFILTGSTGPSYNAYTSGGQAYCTKYGCEYRRFMNASNPSSQRVFRVSTCVSDRAGDEAFTDADPSDSPVGMNYPPSGNPCPAGNQIVPLSNNKTSLTTAINAIQAGGSTGGQVGVAWGWYMLSPSFAHLWPAESQPRAYRAEHLRKFAVLMTDGEYNSAYCSGVIARNSTSGSGAVSDHIDCDSTTGAAYDAAMSMCESMKRAGVTIYTVGFDVVDDDRARSLLSSCASGVSTQYLAANGAQLREAFHDIATQISQLRLTR